MATRKRFTKALFLRLCAVGLFICLGTFAVMHSIHNQKSKNETAELTSNEKKPDTDPEPKIEPVSSTNKVIQTSAIEEEKPKSTIAPPQFKPSAGSNSLPNGSGFSAGNRRLPGSPTTPSSTSLASSRTTSPPTRPNSSSNFSVPPLKPNTSSTAGSSSRNFAQRNENIASPLANRQPPTNSIGSSSNSVLPAIRPNTPPNTTAANTRDPKPPNQPPTLRPGSQSVTNPFGGPDSTAKSPPVSPLRRDGTNPIGNSISTSNRSTPNATSSGSTIPRPTAPVVQPIERPTTGSLMPVRPNNAAPTTANNSSGSIRSSVQPIQRPNTGPAQNVSSPRTATSPLRQTTINSQQQISQQKQQVQPNQTRSTTAQTTLSSTPINRPATNNLEIAQPTPGERTLEGVQVPTLAVQKIAPREIQVNREATFELIVKNTGRVAADNVQVHDYVPEGTRLVETMPHADAGANGQVSWNLGTMSPGQQTTIKMKLLPQRAGNIGSVAHVTFGTQASAQTVCTQPALTIRHEAPATVLIGQEVLLNIFVQNSGTGAAENVVLQEDVPEGLEFPGGQRELEYEIGTLRPGETRNIALRLRAAKVGQARNVLVAHGEGDIKANDSVDVRIVAPEIELTGEGPSRKFLNRKATHRFTVSNTGSAPSTNMQMVARLPRGLRFVDANNNGQYDATNHAVVWRLPQLNAQKAGTVELTTMPVATGQQDINFTAIADLDQKQALTKSLQVEQLSELFFDIDDTADAIEVGSETTYRVRVVNQGQIPATNVQVQVDFPTAIRPESVQGQVRNQINGQTVVLDPIPTLQPGQEIAFTVTANAVQAGDHRTTVSVKSDDRELAVSKQESTHVYSDR